MRAAVTTCTPASASAAVANQAFIAIVDEKTVVTRSVYRSATSAISTGRAYSTIYTPCSPRRGVREQALNRNRRRENRRDEIRVPLRDVRDQHGPSLFDHLHSLLPAP